MKPLILIGMGGHSKVIFDIVNSKNEYEVRGFLDDSVKSYHKKNDLFYDSLKNIDLYKNDYYFCIAIGSNVVREKIFNELNISLEKFPVLSHKSAIISNHSKIGYGTVVMANTVINRSTKIGNHCIINTASVIEHDNLIGDYTHISPGAILTGGVTVQNFSHIGAGATVIPNIKIGQNVIIGAGSTVIYNIEDNVTAVGTPAKIIKENVL